MVAVFPAGIKFSSKIIFTLILLLVSHQSLAAGGGGGGSSPYINLNPPFVVNLNNSNSDIRYLQIAISIKLENESDGDLVKKHMPVIRHNLLILFSDIDFSELRRAEGKAKLTEDVLKETRKKLKKATGKEIVEAVYITKIVGQ